MAIRVLPALSAPIRRFWAWYQRNYLAVLVITTVVFLLQIYHLYWLFTDVVLERLTGTSYYAFSHAGAIVSLFADYLEVPTLVSLSLLYANELRKRFSWKAVAYLLLLNSQWAHILWITDEMVVQAFAQQTVLPWSAAVAWVAILIDFLEIPVILDTLRRVWAERQEIWARLSEDRQERRAAAPRHATPSRLRPAA